MLCHVMAMMTSSNGKFSALLTICAGNSSVTGEFPAQRPVTQSFDDFFDLCLLINGWVNNGEAGDLRRRRDHYDVIVMRCFFADSFCVTVGGNLDTVNTLRPRRNEQNFADDIFKRIFCNENVWISIYISLKFVPKGPINNIPAYSWTAPSHYLNQWWLVYRRIYASLGLNEVMKRCLQCGISDRQ